MLKHLGKLSSHNWERDRCGAWEKERDRCGTEHEGAGGVGTLTCKKGTSTKVFPSDQVFVGQLLERPAGGRLGKLRCAVLSFCNYIWE